MGLIVVVGSGRRWYGSTSTLLSLIVPGYTHPSSDPEAMDTNGIRWYSASMNPSTNVWTIPSTNMAMQMILLGRPVT